jgi:hypothetical protein
MANEQVGWSRRCLAPRPYYFEDAVHLQTAIFHGIIILKNCVDGWLPDLSGHKSQE